MFSIVLLLVDYPEQLKSDISHSSESQGDTNASLQYHRPPDQVWNRRRDTRLGNLDQEVHSQGWASNNPTLPLTDPGCLENYTPFETL